MNRVIITYSTEDGSTQISRVIKICSIDTFVRLNPTLTPDELRAKFELYTKSFQRCKLSTLKDSYHIAIDYSVDFLGDILDYLAPVLERDKLWVSCENYAIYPPDLECSSFLIKAQRISTWAHKDQKRWDGTPYIDHPREVAFSLDVDDFEGRTVAWLHDVVEDTKVTLQDLGEVFSSLIIEAIDAITKREGESYLDSILRVKKNPIATRVKIADLKHNISSLNGPTTKDKKNVYKMALYILQKGYKFFGRPLGQQPDHIHEESFIPGEL